RSIPVPWWGGHIRRFAAVIAGRSWAQASGFRSEPARRRMGRLELRGNGPIANQAPPFASTTKGPTAEVGEVVGQAPTAENGDISSIISCGVVCIMARMDEAGTDPAQWWATTPISQRVRQGRAARPHR